MNIIYTYTYLYYVCTVNLLNSTNPNQLDRSYNSTIFTESRHDKLPRLWSLLTLHQIICISQKTTKATAAIV